MYIRTLQNCKSPNTLPKTYCTFRFIKCNEYVQDALAQMGRQVLPRISAVTIAPALVVVNNFIAVEAAAGGHWASRFARTHGLVQVALDFILRAVNVITHVFIHSGLLGRGAQPSQWLCVLACCP